MLKSEVYDQNVEKASNKINTFGSSQEMNEDKNTPRAEIKVRAKPEEDFEAEEHKRKVRVSLLKGIWNRC